MVKVMVSEGTRHGKPIIEGTRITVDEILGALIGGMTYEEIKEEYGITKEGIIAAIEYAASLIKGEEVRELEIKKKKIAA